MRRVFELLTSETREGRMETGLWPEPRLVTALMILLGATSGCVTSDTLIKLNPDGSGVVVQKTLMSTEMIAQLTAMMQGIAQQMVGNEAGRRI